MFKHSPTELTKKFAYTFLILGLLFAPARTFASTYGSGNYGNCAYGQSCPTSSSGTPSNSTTTPKSSGNSVSEPTTATSGEEILLNSFNEYFTELGKSLTTQANNVIYFNLTTNGVIKKYSVTVNEIGKDYVNITLSSGPTIYKLVIGDAKRFDVNQDQIDDIEISLVGITDGKADMNFKALNVAKLNSKEPQKETTTASKKSNYTLLIASVVLILLGIWLFIFLALKRRKKNQQNI